MLENGHVKSTDISGSFGIILVISKTWYTNTNMFHGNFCWQWHTWVCVRDLHKGFQSFNYLSIQRYLVLHDDVIKWKHFPSYWPLVRGIHRSPVNSPHKGQRRGALMFPLICVWINGWVNNREAGDLRRYRAHYDVTVMSEYVIKRCIPRPVRHRIHSERCDIATHWCLYLGLNFGIFGGTIWSKL